MKYHRVIPRLKIIENPIPKAMSKHIEVMDAREKLALLKFNNRAGAVYDNDWIEGVEYEDNRDKN